MTQFLFKGKSQVGDKIESLYVGVFVKKVYIIGSFILLNILAISVYHYLIFNNHETSFVKYITSHSVFLLSILNLFLALSLIYFFNRKRLNSIISNKIKKIISLSTDNPRAHFYMQTACTVILAGFIIHFFYTLYQTSFNIPFWDEWVHLRYIPTISLENIFIKHNEHRIVFTRLLYYIENYFFNINFRYHAFISFIIYIPSVYLLYIIIRTRVKNRTFLPLLFVPFFTPILYESFYQEMTQWHFLTIFSYLAVYFGFLKESNWKNNLLMFIFLLFSAFSVNITFALGIFIAWVLKEILNNYRDIKTSPLFIIKLISAVAIVGLFAYYYISSSHAKTTEYSNIFTFMYRFLTQISVAVFHMREPGLTALLGVVVLTPIIALIFDKTRLFDKTFQAFYALLFGSAVSLGALCLADLRAGVSERHFELFLSTIPITILLYIEFYRKYKDSANKLVRRTVLVFTCLFFIATSIFLIRQLGKYHLFYTSEKSREVGYQCMQNYYSGTGDGVCPTIFYEPLKEMFDFAKEHSFSFVNLETNK